MAANLAQPGAITNFPGYHYPNNSELNSMSSFQRLIANNMSALGRHMSTLERHIIRAEVVLAQMQTVQFHNMARSYKRELDEAYKDWIAFGRERAPVLADKNRLYQDVDEFFKYLMVKEFEDNLNHPFMLVINQADAQTRTELYLSVDRDAKPISRSETSK